MGLKDRISEDMKSAMKAGEKARLATIRLILAAVKQREVDERIQLDDAQVLSVLEKMIKMRKESVAQFQAGNRADLVDKENAEIALIGAYMPATAVRRRARCPHCRGHRGHRRGERQGHGQGDGRDQGQGSGPGRHGNGRRQAQSQALRLTRKGDIHIFRAAMRRWENVNVPFSA